ncbi:MAG: 4Fe-4S binding protein [Muribaculaceae bacterium]|nr:4Fe-4S binding protein [Muribaculaceae bacterium]
MENLSEKTSFSPRRCRACWKCVAVCPRGAISKVGFLWHRHAKVDYSKCIGCRACVKACPKGCFISRDALKKP